ncbi:hypothetical protein BU16DRAFT_567247 [Lophium mytilinum]|uniref:Zn(2)-C6 fungal-type domain-containing protein n=1 Tax=Lophium mytilinum TaxID=390894 RepID=A0A6A6QAB4_9PEZI|nr:hypothetical protein BU16DRAFT_567247 [Lophium mytilinum]
MKPGRTRRSKTGCLSCRRRRVRCDEKTPACGACSRLGLDCTFDRSAQTGFDITRTSKYRVRFVDSPYTNLLPCDVPFGGSCDPQQPQSQTSDQAKSSPAEALSGTAVVVSSPVYNDAPDDDAPSLRYVSRLDQQVVSANSVVSPPLATLLEASPSSGDVLLDHDTGIAPMCFDLDLNFDFFAVEWPVTATDQPIAFSLAFEVPSRGYQFPSDLQHERIDPLRGHNAADPTGTSRTCTKPSEGVIVRPQDHELIQHYLNVMSRYTKIRHTGSDRIYSQIFSNMALFYAPLYNAIMAWTELHLGQTKSEFHPETARERYNHAIASMHADQDIAQHFEHFIVTIWFLLQHELLAARDVESFCQHLEYAADIVEAHRRHLKAGGKVLPLGPLGARVLVWLGSYDARASHAGSKGRLLQNLEPLSGGHDFIGAAFPGASSDPATADLKSCLRLMLDLDVLESSILQLPTKSGIAPASIFASIRIDLLTTLDRVEGSPLIAPAVSAVANPSRSLGGKLTAKHFNWLLLLANIYSIAITYHRMMSRCARHDDADDLINSGVASARIIRIAL